MDTYFLNTTIEFLKGLITLLLEIIPLSPIQKFIIYLFVTHILSLIKQIFESESD